MQGDTRRIFPRWPGLTTAWLHPHINSRFGLHPGPRRGMVTAQVTANRFASRERTQT